MIKVMLVDDQMLVRQGIHSLLSLSSEIEVIAQADNGENALEYLRQANDVDVLLLDIRMPIMNGLDTLMALKTENIAIPVIILSTFDDHESVMQAIKNGAKAYLLKDVSLETLVDSIKLVYEGNTLIQPAITERLIKGIQSQDTTFESAELPEQLSKRETEILRLMAAGCSNKEMANSLFRSEGTIKNQVSSILNKLGVRDRTRAVLKAIQLGII